MALISISLWFYHQGHQVQEQYSTVPKHHIQSCRKMELDIFRLILVPRGTTPRVASLPLLFLLLLINAVSTSCNWSRMSEPSSGLIQTQTKPLFCLTTFLLRRSGPRSEGTFHAGCFSIWLNWKVKKFRRSEPNQMGNTLRLLSRPPF